MKKDFLVSGTTPLDTDEGRTFAPGETAKVDPEIPHNRRLIEAGRLVEKAAKRKSQKKADEAEEASA